MYQTQKKKELLREYRSWTSFVTPENFINRFLLRYNSLSEFANYYAFFDILIVAYYPISRNISRNNDDFNYMAHLSYTNAS